jgi:hypothetical protein
MGGKQGFADHVPRDDLLAVGSSHCRTAGADHTQRDKDHSEVPGQVHGGSTLVRDCPDISSYLGESNKIENPRLARRLLPAPAPARKITQADPLPTFRGGMTRLLVLLVAFVTTAHAQGYDPPNAPMDIIAPERPRGMPRQRKIAPDPASPIEVLPLDPPAAEPAPAPAPRPVEITPHPLLEWCAQAANSKTPLCRNVGSSRVQR